DFYRFLRANPSRVILGLLDIAGSYEENQAIVAAARRTFDELGSGKFANQEINEADAMMEFCLELNLTIRRAASGVRSCAAFVGCYNEALGTICYANAGHTPGLLRDPSGVTELPATRRPRGVVEAAYKREEFRLPRVKQHFERASLDNAQAIASLILEGVQEFMRTPPTHNDVTALALVRAPEAGAFAIGA